VPARRPTAEQRRAEILEATCQVVVERGYGATRVSDVASKVGVSTALVYTHFETREELMAESFRWLAEADLAALRAEIHTGATPTQQLDEVFTLYAPEEAEAGWVLWIEAWGESIRNPQLRQISRDLDAASTKLIKDIIRAGVASGEFTCSDPHGAAWRLSALLDGLAVQLTAHDDLISRSDLLAWVRAAASAELAIPIERFTTPAT
jgi:AcrR family transcriptional regulator